MWPRQVRSGTWQQEVRNYKDAVVVELRLVSFLSHWLLGGCLEGSFSEEKSWRGVWRK